MKRTLFPEGTMKPQDFYTRQTSDNGVKFLLESPNNTRSNEWLLVAGAESSRYEKAHRETIKATLAGSDSTEQGNILLASLVIDWSFKESCILENVLELIVNSPYIKVNLDRFVVNRINFFKKK